MRRILYISFLLLTCCSPKPTETNNGETPTTPRTIIGNWNWIRTSGGLHGQVIYPKPGESQTYEFTLDSIAYYSRHSDSTDENWNSRFSLREQRSITGKLAPFLYFNDTMRIRVVPQSVWFHGTDTLELLEEAMDGYSYLYVRQ